MSKLISILLISCYCIISNSYALNLKERDIQELFSSSDVVVYVEVVSGELSYDESDTCGVQYVGKVFNSFKGGEGLKTIRFGRYKGLKIGAYYLLFMNWINGSETHSNYGFEIEDKKKKSMIHCDGLVPGYIYPSDGFFENNNGYFNLKLKDKDTESINLEKVFSIISFQPES